MVTAVVQRKADLGTKAFEWGGQEVSLRQQESVIAAVEATKTNRSFYKRKRKK